jgi:CDP-diacylglycerol--serine O-phosphatidyltransferase
MADIMFDWVDNNLVHGRGVNRLDRSGSSKSPEIKNDIRQYRQELRDAAIIFRACGDEELSVTPLVGLGKSSLLNKTIFPDALRRAETDDLHPYFNLPAVLVRNIIQLLRDGKRWRLSSVIKPQTISIFPKISRLKSSARCLISMKSTCGVS